MENIGWWLTLISFIFGILSPILGGLGWFVSPKDNIYVNFFDNHPKIYGGSVSSEIKYPIITVGGTQLIYTGIDDPFDFGWTNNSFRVWIENGRLMVTSSVSDSTGKIVAILENNELTVNVNNSLDFNWDDNAIEVIDQYNRVVLQVQLSGEVVALAGIFASANGGAVAIAPTSIDGPMEIEIRPAGQPIETMINPLFKYPGSKHLHERISK